MEKDIKKAYLCFNAFGHAVLQARALLNMLSYTNLDYIDSCGTEKSSARLANTSDTNGVSIENVTVKLYPNPNNGEFTLAYDLKQTPEATINISDITGNIVYTVQITNENNLININTTDLGSGLYFIKLQNNDRLLWTDKVMISK